MAVMAAAIVCGVQARERSAAERRWETFDKLSFCQLRVDINRLWVYIARIAFVFCSRRNRGYAEEQALAYTPQDIANYFLDRAEENGEKITAMKLQKLVYIAYGWYLALKGERLFVEQIEAWQHGPVIPSLYHEFKRFRGSPIEGRATLYDYDSNDSYIPGVDQGDEDTLSILARVWNIYHPFSGWALRNKTHEKGTPWEQVYDSSCLSEPIPDKLIAEHFRDRISTYLDAANA